MARNLVLRSVLVVVSLTFPVTSYGAEEFSLIQFSNSTSTDESARLDMAVASEQDLEILKNPTHINEGLFIGSAPSSIKRAWDSAVGLFITDKPGHTFANGTGVVVKVEPLNESKSKIFILTAHHVAVGGVKVVGAKSTQDFWIVSNVFMSSRSTVLKGDRDFSVLGHGLDIERVYEKADLALVSVAVDNEMADRFSRIELSDCEMESGHPVFGIGFPAAYLRKRPSRKLIPRPDIVTKRWSIGRYIGQRRVFGKELPQVSSSQDLAEGDSGGPLVDRFGRLIGIQLRGWSDKYHGLSYNASCSTVMTFLKQAGVVKQPSAPADPTPWI